MLQILMEAVEIEKDFIHEALLVELIRMNSDAMAEHIEFCADRLLVALELPRHCKAAANPFPWMNTIILQGKTNFFEKRVSEHALSGVSHKRQPLKERELVFDADF